ncbi:MAG: hypothetical protein NTW14_04690 [bacterium]|nr:hypothetical protein [bacterium]
MQQTSRTVYVRGAGRKTISLILLLPLAVLLALAVTGANDYTDLIAVAAIIFFTVITNFSIALLLIGITSYFLSYSIWYFGLPGPLINLGYILILMVLARQYFFRANLIPVSTPINYILLAIIALGFLSIAAGDSGVYPALKGLLRHVGFPLLFILILIAEPDEKLMKKLVIGIIIAAFIQVLASIWQYNWYTYIRPEDSGMRADYSGGLLGFSCGGYNAVFMAMIFCILIGFMFVKSLKWYLVLGSIALSLPIFLASVVFGLPLFGAAALFMLLVAPLPHHSSLFKRLVAAMVVVAVLMGAAMMGLGNQSFKMLLNPQYTYEYSMKKADSGMGRLQAFEVVASQLRTGREALLGRGPGMITPTSIVDNPNSLVAENPSLYHNLTGYAFTTLELGYSGLVLFLLLFIQVYRFTRRFLKRIDDPFWEAVALGFSGVTFIFIISTVYIDSWIFYPLPFTYWGIAAAIYRVGAIRGILTI